MVSSFSFCCWDSSFLELISFLITSIAHLVWSDPWASTTPRCKIGGQAIVRALPLGGSLAVILLQSILSSIICFVPTLSSSTEVLLWFSLLTFGMLISISLPKPAVSKPCGGTSQAGCGAGSWACPWCEQPAGVCAPIDLAGMFMSTWARASLACCPGWHGCCSTLLAWPSWCPGNPG